MIKQSLAIIDTPRVHQYLQIWFMPELQQLGHSLCNSWSLWAITQNRSYPPTSSMKEMKCWTYLGEPVEANGNVKTKSFDTSHNILLYRSITYSLLIINIEESWQPPHFSTFCKLPNGDAVNAILNTQSKTALAIFYTFKVAISVCLLQWFFNAGHEAMVVSKPSQTISCLESS